MSKRSAVMLTLLIVAGALPASARQKTIRDGVYTAEQAVRGEAAYLSNCSRCHGEDLAGPNGRPLKGDNFADHYREYSLDVLLRTLRTMPPRAASLAEETYLDILAYILKSNDAPAGSGVLDVEGLPDIQFVNKDGPQPVPNMSLVRVAGCLTQFPDGTWLLTRTGEPIRALNPDVLSAEELAGAVTEVSKGKVFRLQGADGLGIRLESHRDRRMQAKGILVRTPTFERISLTALEMVSESCG